MPGAPTPDAPGSARAGVEVPGYHVFHVTRRAPAADVYLAYHPATQAFRDLVVVERVPDAEYAALRQLVEADVAAAAAVRHPGLAPVEEVGLTTDGRLFVAAARPVGRTLREVLAEEGAVRPNRRAIDLGLALADALAAAHECGVTHGWLGPDSVVLVEPRGDGERLVVLGLGTLVAQGAVLAPGAVPPDEAPFVSPERADGGPPSPRGDVFSLGGVILSMLTGGPPPAVRAAGAAETHHAANAVARVLRQARAADPGRRYSSARDVGTALRAVRDPAAEDSPATHPPAANAPGVHPPALSRPTAVPAVAGRGRRRVALAAAGVAVLAAVAGATFTWRGRADVAPLASGALRAPEQVAPTQQVPIPPVPIPPVPTPSVIAALPASVHPAASAPTPAPSFQAAVGAGPSRSVPGESPGEVAGPAASLQEGAAQQAAVPSVAAPQAAPATTVASAAGEVARANADSAGGRVARSVASATTGPVVASTVASRDAASALTGAQAALAEYLGAIEARDLDRLARAYPGMTEPQRRAWTTFFGSVANFRPRLVVDQLRPAGATARAHVRGAYEYENVRPRRAERLPVSFNVTLARDAGGWRVRAVE